MAGARRARPTASRAGSVLQLWLALGTDAMTEAEWFRAQVLTGLDLFEQAIEEVPESRRCAAPPSEREPVRSTRWGDVTLRWIMTRTLQHTHEHTHDVQSLGLYWGWVEFASPGPMSASERRHSA